MEGHWANVWHAFLWYHSTYCLLESKLSPLSNKKNNKKKWSFSLVLFHVVAWGPRVYTEGNNVLKEGLILCSSHTVYMYISPLSLRALYHMKCTSFKNKYCVWLCEWFTCVCIILLCIHIQLEIRYWDNIFLFHSVWTKSTLGWMIKLEKGVEKKSTMRFYYIFRKLFGNKLLCKLL